MASRGWWRRRWVALLTPWVVWVAISLPQSAKAQTLPATGDEQDLWLVRNRPDGQHFDLYYRHVLDRVDSLVSVVPLNGQIMAGCLACSQGRLWLVYPPGGIDEPGTMVQSVQRVSEGSASLRIEQPLPAGTTLVSLAAGVHGPWALVRVRESHPTVPPQLPEESANEVGSEPEPPGADKADGARGAGEVGAELSPDTHEPSAVDEIGLFSPAEVEQGRREGGAGREAITPQDAEAVATPPIDLAPTDRLLWLGQGEWEPVGLPQEWRAEGHRWVLVRREESQYPILVAGQPSVHGYEVWVYEHEQEGWKSWERTIPYPGSEPVGNDDPEDSRDSGGSEDSGSSGGSGDSGGGGSNVPADHSRWGAAEDRVTASSRSVAAVGGTADPHTAEQVFGFDPVVLTVDGQLVVGLVSRSALRLEAHLFVVRPDSLVALGTLGMDSSASHLWAVVPHGQAVALVGASREGEFHWARMDLSGRVLEPPTVLAEPTSLILSQAADYFVLVGVLVLATLIMFVFWRRDPAWNRLELPRGVVLADLGQRAVAAVVDLLPCFGIAAIWFGVNPQEIVEHWPGRSGGWDQMIPGVTVVGLFVAHTMVTELATGQTLGKMILGIRVAGLDGRPAGPWRIVVRNVMKLFDLIAWPLLILPLFVPSQQRLGDLVARTVVVTGGATEQEDQGPADRDKKGDEDRHSGLGSEDSGKSNRRGGGTG